jgi:hypothetical protein
MLAKPCPYRSGLMGNAKLVRDEQHQEPWRPEQGRTRDAHDRRRSYSTAMED